MCPRINPAIPATFCNHTWYSSRYRHSSTSGLAGLSIRGEPNASVSLRVIDMRQDSAELEVHGPKAGDEGKYS